MSRGKWLELDKLDIKWSCKMKWVNEQYKMNLNSFNKVDGIKAIVVYILIMASCFFQGWLYTTDASIALLNSSQIWIPLLLSVMFIGYMTLMKEKLCSIGITIDNFIQSIIYGGFGGCILLVLQAVLMKLQGGELSIEVPLLMNWIVFIIAAFEEEIIFRGYIQTRLSGLVRRQWVVGIMNAILFLLIHYPVRWVATGVISIFELSSDYVISLLVLHYSCDAVYKKTNCLWGAFVLHFIYNAVGAMIVI